MDGVGEIDRRRALRQLDQLALRREGEDAILVHRHPRMLEQLLGAGGMIQDFDQVGNPRHLDVVDRLAFLIGPVGGKAALGLGMHGPIADLDFDPHLRIVDHRGVQRAIAVALGRRDVILEAARDHRPAAVDQAERPIGLTQILHDHAEGHDVGQLLEADMLLGHLAPDRIRMLLAPLDAARLEMAKAERSYDLNKIAELKHGRIPQLESELAKAEKIEAYSTPMTLAPMHTHAINSLLVTTAVTNAARPTTCRSNDTSRMPAVPNSTALYRRHNRDFFPWIQLVIAIHKFQARAN